MRGARMNLKQTQVQILVEKLPFSTDRLIYIERQVGSIEKLDSVYLSKPEKCGVYLSVAGEWTTIPQ